jgi:hypothetical protein
MNLFWAALIVVLVAAVAATAMLLVRRRAPAGSYFEDGDRAAGVFGVLATGFAVLLGFVVFLAFESFDTSRSGAVTEAQTIAEQFETAQLMPAAVRGRFSGELICYARSVVHQEWPKMQSGGLDAGHNPWGLAMSRRCRRSSRVRRPSRPRTGSGSIRPRTASRPGAIGSTAPKASPLPRSGSSSS